jgi:DNA (cytosine-5)-methyltransferase 1
MSNEPTAVGLFSGCGGLDLGLERAGFDVVLGSDKWEQATETYSHNFDSTVLTEDVTELSGDELRSHIDNPDDISLVAGGPPCQGFSRLNNEQIELDEMEKDERNTLFHDFLRLATSLEPDVILMENVRDLINREMSDGTYVKDAIVTEFANKGYDCDYRVLNAEEYGTPQKRRRIFFIGVAPQLDIQPSSLFPQKTHDSGSYNTAGDALDGVDDSLPNMYYTNSSDETIEKIRHIPQGGYYDDLPDRLKTRDEDGNIVKRYGTYLRRIDPAEPSLTINTNLFIHPSEDRYLTLREMARLQEFPDTFEFYGNKGDVLKQIGNAVPVGLAEQIGESIKRSIGS